MIPTISSDKISTRSGSDAKDDGAPSGSFLGTFFWVETWQFAIENGDL